MKDCNYSLRIIKEEVNNKYVSPKVKYAFETSIEALEKQLPKEVNTNTINRGIDISGEYDIESNMLCPNCNSVVGDYEADELYYNYCPDCGQKLKYTIPQE